MTSLDRYTILQNPQKYCPKCKNEINNIEKCELKNNAIVVEQNEDNTKRHLLYFHTCPMCNKNYMMIYDLISYIPCDISIKIDNHTEIDGMIGNYACTLAEDNKEKLLLRLNSPRIKINQECPKVNLERRNHNNDKHTNSTVMEAKIFTNNGIYPKSETIIKKDISVKILKNNQKNINTIRDNKIHKIMQCTIFSKEDGDLRCLIINNKIESFWNMAQDYEVDSIVSIESPIAKLCIESIASNKKQFRFNDIENTIISFNIFDDDFIKAIRKPVVKMISSSNKDLIYVYKGKLKCFNEKHSIESVRANTYDLLSNKTVEINVEYCRNCNKYFMDHNSLALYFNKSIYPRIKFSIVHYKAKDMGFGEWNKYSKMRLYGYNVIKGRLTASQRHLIISKILDYGLMEKHEIIEHLRFQIDFMGKKNNMEEAVLKWEEDLMFVNKHKINQQRKINGIVGKQASLNKFLP